MPYPFTDLEGGLKVKEN